MLLQHVDADVLLQIFAPLDVFTILSLSRVNKYFHALTATKQLWLSVVRDLTSRCLIDPPSAEVLETFSTAQLVEEVKRVVFGPRTWSPASSAPPTLLRQRTISLDDRAGTSFLPDGRHILVYKSSGSRGVECWDMLIERRVWVWSSPLWYVQYAAFDFRRGGAEARVVLSATDTMNEEYRFIILEADLSTGESRELLDFSVDGRFHRPAKIAGDCFACGSSWNHPISSILLVNWRSAKFILFDTSSGALNSDFALCPGNLLLSGIASAADPASADQVRIYSIASFDHLWRPISQIAVDCRTDITGLQSTTFDVPGNILRDKRDYRGHISLSLSESLVHEDAYELMVKVVNHTIRPTSVIQRMRNRLRSVPPSWLSTVSRYRLTVQQARTPSPPIVPQLKCVLRDRQLVTYTSMSGYGLSWGDVESLLLKGVVIHQLGSKHRVALPMPQADAPYSVRMAHAGAILFEYYDSRIVLCHYV
ncbi:hypothetical protein DFH09DRAFT_1157347 [Mycena vulgaris]|nr:hypothetical protein DFH09DRAFT_1157347 [Mycena vulgaris]